MRRGGTAARRGGDYFDAGLSGTNIERAGSYNRRVTLQAIRTNGPLSKADLSDITGLSPPAIGNIVKHLIEENLVREAGRVQGGRGQPALQLTIDAEGSFSIGVNVDRDHVTMVALDFLGEVRASWMRDMSFPLPGEVFDLVTAQYRAWTDGGLIVPERIAGIGIAIPDDLGTIRLPHRPPGYEDWNRADLAGTLGRMLGHEVLVGNDASVAALGELQFGHGLRNQNFFYVLVSAGLGGGLVVDGHVVAGANNRSGEIGLLPVGDPEGPERTVQDLVSLSGLFAALEDAGAGVAAIADLDALDERGRMVVRRWCGDAADLLLQPLLAINAAINPEAIYVGGRLPAPIITDLTAEITDRMRRSGRSMPAIAPIQRAALSENAAAMGAAILPFSDRFLPLRSTLMKVER